MSVLWTPAEITTALWLDADDSDTVALDGSDVSQWDDKSGNDRHFSQASSGNRPEYVGSAINSLGSVRFNGTSDRLSRDSDPPIPTGTGDYAIFAVVSATDGSTFRTVFATGDYGTSNAVVMFRARATYGLNDAWWANNLVTGNNVIVDSTAALISTIYDGTGRSIRVSGEEEASDSQTSKNTGTGTTYIGAAEGGVGNVENFFEGDVAEVICLTEAPDTETRQIIEGYLAHKWGTEGELDAGHTYKSEAPTVPLGPVENVQATSLGSDSIQVTWDQFTNDESPPVAADGYEIEIDSGTPIDVGDVQTYTDEDLDPSTQYSYRVRAYYSGSPTEYTEWSESVQATTDSETLTTIPRSFVITADIKMRDEAPEVSEPPGAFDGWMAVSRDNGPDSIHIFQRKGGLLTFSASYDVPDSGSNSRGCVRFSNAGSLLAVCHGDSPSGDAHFSIFDVASGVLSVSDQFTNGRIAFSCDWSPDDSRILVGTSPLGTTPSNQNIALLSQIGGSLTQLDIAQITAANNCRTVSYCPDGIRAAAQITDGSNTLHLLSLSGDSISVLDTIAVGGGDPQSSKCIAWRPDGRYLAQTTAGTLRVYDSDGDSLSLTDSITATSSDIAWNSDGSMVFTADEAFSFNGTTLAKVGDTGGASPSGVIPMAITPDDNFLASRQSTSTFRMFNISSLPGTQTDEETVSATMRSFDFTDAK